jgi:glycogen synthase
VRGVPPGHDLDAADERLRPVLGALSRNVGFVAEPVEADVVHAHTWYAQLGGVLASLMYGIPLVVTIHSLEPLRPWKREQLGGGYEVSAWIERTALEMAAAVVAVSQETRADVLRLFPRVSPERVHVIHNGIDTEFYQPDDGIDAIERFGIDLSVPYVLFVGRITRQKGIIHLVRAIRHLDPGIGVVLCAGQPDTPQIDAEMRTGVAEAQSERPNVVWIGEMVSREAARQLYSHAAVFCCPSVYEPFGIINLEAAACETPVVASAVGGIPEVVVDGETGLLVPVDLRIDDPMSPIDADRFERNLAGAINALMADATTRKVMGRAGRRRAIDHFGWTSIAERTVALYESLIG